jgi:hypothetical protein
VNSTGAGAPAGACNSDDTVLDFLGVFFFFPLMPTVGGIPEILMADD